MSDFDRNAATAQYGRPLTRAEAGLKLEEEKQAVRALAATACETVE